MQAVVRHRDWSLTAMAVVCLTGGSAARASAQGVYAALTPASQSVAAGSDFTLEIQLPQTSSAFNAFDAVFSYDPLALTYLPMSPLKQQEGCLLNGLCSASCGNTSHFVQAGGDSLWVSDGLLCAGTRVAGPGQLYRVRFRAAVTPQVTFVRLRRFFAYDGGPYVTPISTSDATVGIGVTADVSATGAIAGLAVRATPNPARGTVSVSLSTEHAGVQDIRVHDVLGRSVRVLANDWQAVGTRQLAWDGRDNVGSRVPPGLYLVTVRSGGRSASSRVVMID